jgi:hypothetical protein
MNYQFTDSDMNIPNNNHRNIVSLPNEILLMIINKLNISDVVYSFMDINERFTQLVVDCRCIRNLDMTIMSMNSFYDRTFSINDKVLSRICDNILPRIHNQVTKIIVEQHSMERILSINYPQLYSLTLVNFKEEIFSKCLTGILLST